MSTRGLPLQPSLQHLKNEAKQLHKALLAGDAEAIDRVRAGLPRLADDDDESNSLLGDVTLMEAQHVLAREYGYREWPHLAAAAELTFDGLAGLSDVDTNTLLRHVDQRDLIVALKQLAGDAVKERMLTGMSPRVRQFIIEEMEFLGPMPEDEIREVQGRIVQQTRQLAEQGKIGWPPGADTPAPEPPEVPPLAPDLADIGQPLDDLSVDQARALVHALGARASQHGILSLEHAANAAGDPFVAEGLRLAVDGTEPDLLKDILMTRARALLQHLENRCIVAIEGVMAIHAGDNPRIVIYKLLCIYRDYSDGPDIEPTGADVDALVAGLRERPASSLDLDGLATFLADVARHSRREGLATLAPLTGAVDEPLLQEGMRMLAASAPAEEIMETLKPMWVQAVDAARLRLGLLAAGLAALQAGKRDADLDAAIDAAIAKADRPG